MCVCVSSKNVSEIIHARGCKHKIDLAFMVNHFNMAAVTDSSISNSNINKSLVRSKQISLLF